MVAAVPRAHSLVKPAIKMALVPCFQHAILACVAKRLAVPAVHAHERYSYWSLHVSLCIMLDNALAMIAPAPKMIIIASVGVMVFGNIGVC